MITPALLSGEGYSLAFASETPRTNFLRGGLSFGTAYDDNVLPSSGHAISDVRYSIWPNLSLQQSRARLAWSLNYSPGFGVYQHNSSINEIDHYLTVDLSYRWTPHVTLSLKESFQKTSNLMNLSQSAGAPDTYVTAPSTESLVAPAIARTSSFTEVEVNYQFGPNAKVGAKGTLSGLWYANQADVTGLFNSTAQGTELYYSHRFSQKQYVGVTYGFQRFLTHPGQRETHTQSTLLFYTLDLPPTLEVSLFAGPEYSDTSGGASSVPRKWSPALGGSLGWHRNRASFVVGYSQRISDSGGLSGAVPLQQC